MKMGWDETNLRLKVTIDSMDLGNLVFDSQRSNYTSPPGGRLTLVSGLPVMVSSVPSASTVRYTPYVGENTVLGLGTTEPLRGDIQAWAGWVMALWFGGRSLEKIATVIWRGRWFPMDLAILGLTVSSVSASGAILAAVSFWLNRGRSRSAPIRRLPARKRDRPL